MKSRLSTVLRKEFHKKMTCGLPDFEKSGTAFGGVIYRKRDDVIQRNVFVFLEPDPKYDRFTLELAVSLAPEFPFDILPGNRTPAGSARSRIRSYLEPKSDGWWRANQADQLLEHTPILHLLTPASVDLAAARLPALVDDAFHQLQAALPRFLATIKA
jgi:hypothetical protein